MASCAATSEPIGRFDSNERAFYVREVNRAPEGIDRRRAQERIATVTHWYHTIDVAPDVTTPGWYDLRHIVDLLPWPDVRGKRCLDVGTFDGFFAFELERRGAAEVVAIDMPDHEQWDWPPDTRPDGPNAQAVAEYAKLEVGKGFRILAELFESKVQWRPLNIYDVDAATLGTFDVVVCGSLLLHLRDPVRALEALRTVCSGFYLSSEAIAPLLSIFGRGKPLFHLSGTGSALQWWIPNGAGHRRLLWSAGFEIERASRPYLVHFNLQPSPKPSLQTMIDSLTLWLLTGDRAPGMLHRALLARPRL